MSGTDGAGMERSHLRHGHRVASAAVAAVLALGAAGVAQPAWAASGLAAPAAVLGVGSFRLADIPAADGVVLKADVFTPAPGTPGADPQGHYPLVVQPASWGQNDLEYVAQGRAFAAAGYVVVTYTVRGFWGSG